MRRLFITLALLSLSCVQTEVEVKTECADGEDNDGDGRIDVGDDFGCANDDDDTEAPDPPRCGDGIIQNAEECDSDNLNGETCLSLGLQDGALVCAPNCVFGTAGCGVTVACNNNIDDDSDGFTDEFDPGCEASSDGDEDFFSDSCRGVGGPIFEVTFADTSVDVLVPGSTVGGANDFNPTDTSDDCTSATGPEIVLMYRLFTAQTVTFSLDQDGTDFDTVLYVRKNDCLNGIEFCNDDTALGLDKQSILTLNLTSGDYFIFIDGFGGESGNFELLIDLAN